MLQCISQPGSRLLLDPLSKATFLHHRIACLFVLSSGLRAEQGPASFVVCFRFVDGDAYDVEILDYHE